VINFAVEEMICSANLSFGMYPGLSNGAYNALHLHGTDEQKRLYLPKLVGRHLVRHHVLDGAALRHRPRPDQTKASRTATAATSSPAPRSSSPPASMT
jgi:hypothetical protein